MRWNAWLVAVVAFLTTFGALPLALALAEDPPQREVLSALDGDWIYVEDLTEGRTLEQLGPPMASSFSMRVEEGAVILNGHGSGHRDVRIALDGSITEVVEKTTTSRYSGAWKDGVFGYQVEFVRTADQVPDGLIQKIRRDFEPTEDGLRVTVAADSRPKSHALYRHAEDIPLPTPAAATLTDVSWLEGAWVGTRSSGSSIEERWSPPLGGAMLAVSRSVNTSGKMFAFEYLRIVERDGGLVYVAQPGGADPTEFVLTELGPNRVVFDNPRHDYPKRIVYELTVEGGLKATTGFLKGGTPRLYEYRREAK